jgi:hypothetical protein
VRGQSLHVHPPANRCEGLRTVFSVSEVEDDPVRGPARRRKAPSKGRDPLGRGADENTAAAEIDASHDPGADSDARRSLIVVDVQPDSGEALDRAEDVFDGLHHRDESSGSRSMCMHAAFGDAASGATALRCRATRTRDRSSGRARLRSAPHFDRRACGVPLRGRRNRWDNTSERRDAVEDAVAVVGVGPGRHWP